VSLVGFQAQNHRQQVAKRGPRPEVDNLETPWEFFEPLNARFDFTLDACALPHNTKCKRFYGPPGKAQRCMWAVDGECGINGCAGCEHGGPGSLGVDGLTKSWRGERVWCNPPYSSLEPWVEKAWQEAIGAPLIVMLLPANRTEQKWWQRHVEPYRDRGDKFRVEFLPGRLRFIKHGHDRVEPNQRPPFGCCLLIWQHLSEHPGANATTASTASCNPKAPPGPGSSGGVG